MKTIILLAIFGLLLMVLTSNAKRLYYDNDNDIDLADEKARMILRSMMEDDSSDDDSSELFNKRAKPNGCVKCAMGLIDCCPPDICQKRTFAIDKCLKIKPGK